MKPPFKLQQELKTAKYNLSAYKHNVKRLFRAKHKKQLIWMDSIILFLVLMNFGAVFMTNSMVIRVAQEQGIEFELQEANPVMAEEHNLNTSPEVQKEFMIFVSHAMKWGLLLMAYILIRFNVYQSETLIAMLCVIAFYAFMIGLDFFNDLGFYIHTII